jgi:ribonuclease R
MSSSTRPPSQVTGTVRGTRSGYAFLIRDDGGEDLPIPVTGLGGAIHGDRVRADLVRSHYDFRTEAIVEEILERPNPLFTGDVVRERKAIYVRPDSPMLPERMPLQMGSHRPTAGAKILFRVENLEPRHKRPIAVFEEMIGEAGDARLDPIVIATEFGIPTRFSDEALEVAEEAVATPPKSEDAGRVDMRDQLVLTIDPVDAKDFDDAVSLERDRDGSYRLTVHVADVTAYVPEGSALDEESLARATSTYFPGTVFPMLPEEISNGAASLSPHVDKRAITTQMHFSPEGEFLEGTVTKSWIKSSARLHYDQVQQILDGGDAKELGVPDEAVVRALFRMRELAALLRERRFRQGGFDLDVPEARMELRADGVPKKIERSRNEPSHWLIEEFMIAANRTVGGWAKKLDLPFLYRIHEEPDPQALEEFAEVAMNLDPAISPKVFESQRSLREWLGALPESPATRVLHRYFLRSMKKAAYSAADIGHFGLGIDGYCHFTSPIRRYPDLFNHRRVKEKLAGKVRADLRGEVAESIATHASYRETNSEEAEREIIRLKSARYLDERLGKEAPGHVTGITPRGLFVELDRVPVDGFVPSQTLPHRAQFVEERLAWADPRSGWELRPGDPVRVQIVAVDLRLRRSEFRLIGVARGGLRPGQRRGEEDGRPRRGRRRSESGERRSGGGRARSESADRGLGAAARPRSESEDRGRGGARSEPGSGGSSRGSRAGSGGSSPGSRAGSSAGRKKRSGPARPSSKRPGGSASRSGKGGRKPRGKR